MYSRKNNNKQTYLRIPKLLPALSSQLSAHLKEKRLWTEKVNTLKPAYWKQSNGSVRFLFLPHRKTRALKGALLQ